MRDLGIDHQAGRYRRIPVLKTRYQKAKQRRLKLRALRLPSLSNRLRLYKGGIQSVAMWGVEAQGLAPRYRTVLRQALGRQLGHHRGGLLDVIYDFNAKRYQDLGDQIILSHIKAFKDLLDAWPADQHSHISRQLATTSTPTTASRHQVKGPMAAVIVYMWEWQWHLTEPHLWHRDVQDYGPEMEIDLTEPWWKLEATPQREATYQRLRRLRQRKNCQRIRNGLDWRVFNQIQ